MTLKQFLKPDWRKIVVFVVLFIPTAVIPNFGFGIWWGGADIGISYGFPFNFYGYGGGPELLPGEFIPVYFHYEAIVENIIIWYLLSCLIVWIYDKVRKR